MVSDEPDIDAPLTRVLEQLGERHELLWVLITDMPAVGSAAGEPDGYDVVTGAHVLNGATLGPRIVEAYRRREAQRSAALTDLLTARRISFTRIAASGDIHARLRALTADYAHAG